MHAGYEFFTSCDFCVICNLGSSGHLHEKFCAHITDCSPMELWNLSATEATFLLDVSLLNDSAARYPSCDAGHVGSAVLKNITLNTATVAYYSGTTPGSTVCFVCDETNGYEQSASMNIRVCQSNATWSNIPIVCSKLC